MTRFPPVHPPSAGARPERRANVIPEASEDYIGDHARTIHGAALSTYNRRGMDDRHETIIAADSNPNGSSSSSTRMPQFDYAVDSPQPINLAYACFEGDRRAIRTAIRSK